MKRNNRKKIVGAGMLTVLAVVFVIGIFFNMQVTKPIVENKIIKIEQEKWQIRPLGDASVGLNVTGFKYAMLYPHQASPGTAYASNLSNATAYEYADCVNCSMTGETPYNTAFDIVYKIQVSNTDGYNASAGAWQDAWVRMYYNETGLSISSQAMTEITIANGTSEKYYHYYLNNGGAGYQFSKGQNFNGSWNFEVWG